MNPHAPISTRGHRNQTPWLFLLPVLTLLFLSACSNQGSDTAKSAASMDTSGADMGTSTALVQADEMGISLHPATVVLIISLALAALGLAGAFAVPPLPPANFRWNKALGGGALLDTGAYMAKVSQLLLGSGLEVVGACQRMDDGTGVDIYGEAMFRDGRGRVAQVAYGFDYFYQCRVELLGTKGKLSTNRVYTAPPGFEPVIHIETAAGARELRIPADNHYVNMWAWFAREVRGRQYTPHWDNLRDQARLLDGMKVRN